MWFSNIELHYSNVSCKWKDRQHGYYKMIYIFLKWERMMEKETKESYVRVINPGWSCKSSYLITATWINMDVSKSLLLLKEQTKTIKKHFVFHTHCLPWQPSQKKEIHNERFSNMKNNTRNIFLIKEPTQSVSGIYFASHSYPIQWTEDLVLWKTLQTGQTDLIW